MSIPREHRHEERGSVFLVETDIRVCSDLKTMFRRVGWHVAVSDGSVTLPKIRPEYPFVFLIAAGREGLDERRVIRQIRDHPVTAMAPVILLMDRLETDLAVLALKEGADDIALGPYSAERMIPRVRAHLILARLRREEVEHAPRLFEQLRASEQRARKAEKSLRRSEQKLRLIIESSTDFAIFTLDLEGKVTLWNSGASQLFGYTEEEIVGSTFERVFSEEDVKAGIPEREMREALESGRAVDQRWHRRKDGNHFWADGFVMPIRDEQDKLTGYLKIVRDYTAQKKAMDDLKAIKEDLENRVTERTRSLEKSRTRLRALVYELNRGEQMERERIAAELHDNQAQLLVAAEMVLDSMKPEFRDSASLKQLKKIIHEASVGTRNLMSELSGPPVMLDHNLVTALRFVVKKMAEKDLDVQLSHTAERIPLDREMLVLITQSVRELLLNTLKYAGVDQASIHVERSSKWVEVTVVDCGCGFDPQQVVSQRQEGGFGLLNIEERLRWLDGQLQIESAPGEGTLARIRVPLEPLT